MKTEHTQGPWKIDGKTRFGDYTIAAGENVKACEFVAKTQSEANARLIVAAPELLAALKSISDYVAVMHGHRGGDISENAIAAINKAEGNA